MIKLMWKEVFSSSDCWGRRQKKECLKENLSPAVLLFPTWQELGLESSGASPAVHRWLTALHLYQFI